jgi:hypothetical protein
VEYAFLNKAKAIALLAVIPAFNLNAGRESRSLHLTASPAKWMKKELR